MMRVIHRYMKYCPHNALNSMIDKQMHQDRHQDRNAILLPYPPRHPNGPDRPPTTDEDNVTVLGGTADSPGLPKQRINQTGLSIDMPHII